MVKFEKLNIDSIAKIKKNLISTAVFLILAGAVAVAAYFIDINSKELTQMESEMKQLNASIVEVSNHNKSFHDSLQNMSLKQSSITSKEDIVITLGECTKKAGCSITGLSSNTVSEDSAITRYNFSFEVKGSLSNISSVLRAIDNKDLHYSVNEMSLRQVNDFLWLQRDINDTITWWDLSNVSTSGGEQSKNGITVKEIMGDDNMKLYINLDFIVINEVL